MGEKGSRFTGEVADVAEAFVATVDTIGDVTWRRMFGGAGVFVEDKMFALIDSDGRLHLKADESNRDRFEAAGAEKHTRMPYFTVPAEVLANEDELRSWAAESASIAAR